jgi:hypothetical protein
MAFPLLIFDHFECPDMFKYMFFCHPERVRQLADEPRDLRGKAQAGIPPFLRQLANSVGMTRKVYEFRSEWQDGLISIITNMKTNKKAAWESGGC